MVLDTYPLWDKEESILQCKFHCTVNSVKCSPRVRQVEAQHSRTAQEKEEIHAKHGGILFIDMLAWRTSRKFKKSANVSLPGGGNLWRSQDSCLPKQAVCLFTACSQGEKAVTELSIAFLSAGLWWCVLGLGTNTSVPARRSWHDTSARDCLHCSKINAKTGFCLISSIICQTT